MKKRDITLVLCILSSIFVLAFDFLKFDFIIKVKSAGSFGAEIVSGFLVLIPYGLYGILAIWSLIYIFKKYRSKKWMALLPAIIILVTVLLLGFFPYTKMYLDLNYSINKARFQQTIHLVDSGEIKGYKKNYQLGSDEYIAPYRLSSYSGVVRVQVHNDVTKLMFSAYKGYSREVVIVYSSDDSGINKKDFSDRLNGATWNFSNIKKIDGNWYSATVNGLTLGTNWYPSTVPSAS